ncbi:MAG: hypothetical protein QOF85_783 [Solirubrobacterales bacterium]|jgi:hypothetical protein|nr:hypothetical protein [Solirubrobacterales bacterium]
MGNAMATRFVGTESSGLSTAGLSIALGIDQSTGGLAEIDWRQVEAIARQIASTPDFREFEPASWDDDLFWNVAGNRSERSQFFAVGNSINFRFWRLEGESMAPAVGTLDGTTYRGAMYMWRALRRELDRGGGRILDAGFLATMSESDFDAIFSDDTGLNPLAIGADDRLANLRDLGRHLLAEWNGEFLNLLEETGGSLVRFAELSRGFRAFDDPIFKLTMLNAILLSGSGVFEFRDEPLPAIDYHLLRHALRQGMLRPEPRLEQKLKASRLLSGEEALELRRLALVAFVAIAERTGLSGAILDNKFWLNRVNCTDIDPVCLDPATALRCPFYGACIQAVEFPLPLELTRYY